MRQTSEQFLDEMLKDNSDKIQTDPSSDLAEKIAKTIDEKMAESMKKFQEQFSKINPPDTESSTPGAEVKTPEETNNETIEESNNEEDNK